MTEDPITLQDLPPSFRDRAVFTVITEVEGGQRKCSTDHVNIPPECLLVSHAVLAYPQLWFYVLIHNKIIVLIKKIFAAVLRKVRF